MQPSNGLIGDAQPTELPEMKPDEQTLVKEKRMARFGKSKDFGLVKEHFEAKIAYYQQFLPGGNIRPSDIPEEERGKYWALADLLIKEFQEVITMFDTATEVVENEKKSQLPPYEH